MRYTWVDAAGCDISGTETISGYNLRDYFPDIIDLETSNDADLRRAYLGPDCDGIGVKWCADA